MKKYLLEFKVAGKWVATEQTDDIDTLTVAEHLLHKAGIKARVVMITTDREII